MFAKVPIHGLLVYKGNNPCINAFTACARMQSFVSWWASTPFGHGNKVLFCSILQMLLLWFLGYNLLFFSYKRLFSCPVRLLYFDIGIKTLPGKWIFGVLYSYRRLKDYSSWKLNVTRRHLKVEYYSIFNSNKTCLMSSSNAYFPEQNDFIIFF